ncbi:MAG: MATE family efflux transporter [Candidatus Methanomethylophilaceae archaeon]|nr:MATE family efflux transporter [Candidatus Methanomethylophilaceae archaeon]
MADSEKELERMLGDPRKAIAAMFVPLLAAMAVGQVNSFVDTFFTSGLGVEASSGLSTMIPVYDIFIYIGIGMSVGATTTIAFRLGKGDRDAAGRIASLTVRWSLLLSLVSSVLVLFATDPIIDMMGAGEIRSYCWEYMLPFIVLSPTIIVYEALGGMLRGEGAAKRSTAIQISAALLNMAFDPILIYGFGWGLTGAALATCLAYAISMIIGFRWYRTGRTVVRLSMRRSEGDRLFSKELFDIAGPKTGEQMITAVTDIIQRLFLVIAGGTVAILLYNLPWRYVSLINLPASALATAMIPVCAAAFGARDIFKMKDGFRYTFKWSLIVSIALSLMLFLLADYFAMIFTYEESMAEIRPQLVWTLQWFALLIPANCVRSFLTSTLQSMKHSKDAMNINLVWSIIKLALFGAVCQYGFEAIIYALVFMNYFGIILNYWLYRRALSMTENAIAGPEDAS